MCVRERKRKNKWKVCKTTGKWKIYIIAIFLRIQRKKEPRERERKKKGERREEKKIWQKYDKHERKLIEMKENW